MENDCGYWITSEGIKLITVPKGCPLRIYEFMSTPLTATSMPMNFTDFNIAMKDLTMSVYDGGFRIFEEQEK